MKALRLRKSKITPDEVKTLYVVELMTMQEIAERAGVSKQAIKLILDRTGIEYRGGKIDKQCLFCKETFKAVRSYHKQGRGNYCSQACFHASHSISGEYSINGGAVTRLYQSLREQAPSSDRLMGRQARKAIEESGIQLRRGQVVHHIDGNRSNNSLDNLMVFDSQSEHMRYHHSLRPK
jgi:hypothetical protein